MNILEQIVANKRIEIAARKQQYALESLRFAAAAVTPRPRFDVALRAVPMGLIAEVKRRSPSAGLIRDPFDPAAIARDYEMHGATAISCLMDKVYFGGGAEDFSAVREAVALPMLYKEFVIDPWQIVHAKVVGASAILLIAAILPEKTLLAYMKAAGTLGLKPLVEVHDAEEMRRAVAVGADCIGINNRNLKTFVTALETTEKLVEMVPSGCTVVSESGIRTSEDVLRMKRAGAHAVLVGESLLREVSPGCAAVQLMAAIQNHEDDCKRSETR